MDESMDEVTIIGIDLAKNVFQLWFPSGLVDQAKEHGEKAQKSEGMDMDHGMKGSFRDKLLSRKGWQRIAQAFFMEWKLVWKEILFGFTTAGFISVFVPQSFWNAIFLIGDGGAQQSPGFFIVLENALVAPVVAFFTFIGSMGNVPLAAMLWSRDASFGGVVAFLGADLVAATVILVHAKYYGWRYALYLSGLLYLSMVAAGITVHYLFALVGMIPTERPSLQEMVRFAIDYTFFLNLAFLAAAAALLWLHFRDGDEAALDIRDLRSLVDCIRLVRRTAMQTAVRMITTGVMLALLAGIAIKLKIFGGGP